MILLLEFFILQRLMNITLEIAMQVHQAGIEFMEAAKRVDVASWRNQYHICHASDECGVVSWECDCAWRAYGEPDGRGLGCLGS